MLVSCSHVDEPLNQEEDALYNLDENVNKMPENWFSGDKRFVQIDHDDEVMAHIFFDYTPAFDEKDLSLNYYPVTLKDASARFDFDLLSGKKFFRHNYCEQKDVWETYKKDLEFPIYTEGVIPRMLDSNKRAQKIIVFGELKKEERTVPLHRARIVGSVILQYCSSYPCSRYRPWVSTLLLVGVDTEDEEFSKITKLSELKEQVKWEYVKAFLQNGPGRLVQDKRSLPAYRLVSDAEATESLETLKKIGHEFKDEELKTMKSSCQKLYLSVANGVAEQRNREKILLEQQEKVRVIEANRYRSKDRELEERVEIDKLERMKRENFAVWFADFYEKYGEQYKTCSRYVRTTSINFDPKEHWFFQYFNLFFRLHDENLVYACNRRTFVYNETTSDGAPKYDPKVEYRKCSLTEIDEAFKMAISIISNERLAGGDHYSFIEYDSGIFGSKEKLYTWVYNNGKRPFCVGDDPNQIQSEKENSLLREIFPKEIEWESFDKLREFDREQGIIR